MPENKWIESIHKEIDGLNSPEESSKLKAYLMDHPEEQELYNDLRQLTLLMKNTEAPEPSPALKSNILSKIPYNLYPRRKMTNAAMVMNKITDFLTAGYELKLNLRYATAFAAGFVVSMIVFFVYQNTVQPHIASDSAYMQGAMGLPEDLTPLEEADQAVIDMPTLRGTVNIYFNKDIIQVKLNLRSSEPVDITIGFDRSDLSFGGLRLLNDPESCKMDVSADHVMLAHEGNRSYWLIFTNKTRKASHLTFRILSAGTLIHEMDLKTSDKSKE